MKNAPRETVHVDGLPHPAYTPAAAAADNAAIDQPPAFVGSVAELDRVLEKEAAGWVPEVNVTIRRIEVPGDDPDAFVKELVDRLDVPTK